jgi:hypothetical protein
LTEVLYYAVPFFVLLLVVEGISFRHVEDDHDVRTAATWRERAGHLWHGPGWRPEEEPAR